MARSPLTSRLVATLRRSRAAMAAVPAVVLVVSLAAVAAVVTTPENPTEAASSTASAPNAGEWDRDGAVRVTNTTTGSRTGDSLPGEVDEDREPELTGPRGVITAGDAPASATPAPTALAPVALDPVEGPAPVVVPPSEPTEVDVLAGPGGPGTPGGLVAAGTPCQLGCITRATLHRELRSTDVRLHMETSVKTRMWVGVFDQAPAWIGGSPVVGDAAVRVAHLSRTSWEPTFSGLAANTTYHVIVRARDAEGNDHYEATDFTTVTPIEVADDLAATPSGCRYQCIESGVVAAITHESALLQVNTSAPATLTAWVSTDEPGWIAGSPILPASAAIPLPMALKTDWQVPVGGLVPETTYHVVVRATDDEGRHSSRVGHFTTPPEPPTLIEVTVEKIHVVYDGDKQDWNAGELSFSWGAAYQTWGTRGTDEIHDDTSIDLSEQNSRTLSVDPGAFMPRIMVAAMESDYSTRICIGGLAPIVTDEPYSTDCGYFANSAATGLQTVETVESMLSCASYGVIGDGEDDRCDIIFSVDGLGDDYPRFWALVSYRFV